ncbi:MAG: biopolymer transporter ExbD [Myxococcales bacterium]|jgi:biopolymer transport protein ExbD|nr:biopolymer transporter ExbD [Myxococcales bacterium]
MAGGMDMGGGGKGKKRALDVAINLVPCIDLFSVLITFLIMTAVWNQIDRLTVTQSGGPSTSEPTPEESKTLPLNLQITERGFFITTGEMSFDIEKSDGKYVYCLRGQPKDVIEDPTKCDEHSLVGALRKIKGDGLVVQRNITVQCKDDVPYRELVRVVDVCNLKDSANNPILFPDVAISALDPN